MLDTLVPSDFYTYAYLDSSNVPYYIGKGRQGRAYEKHRNVELPSRDRIIFLKKGLSEEQALKHEEYMIAVIGRRSNETGVLQNKLNRGSQSYIQYKKESAEQWADCTLCSIFGSRTAACTLLFIHVNKEAHALRIAKTFDFGLNQTQRQLKKFEESCILVSRKVGNVRLYTFNERLPAVRNLRVFLESYPLPS